MSSVPVAWAVAVSPFFEDEGMFFLPGALLFVLLRLQGGRGVSSTGRMEKRLDVDDEWAVAAAYERPGVTPLYVRNSGLGRVVVSVVARRRNLGGPRICGPEGERAGLIDGEDGCRRGGVPGT